MKQRRVVNEGCLAQRSNLFLLLRYEATISENERFDAEPLTMRFAPRASPSLPSYTASKPHFSDSHTQQDAQELLNAILDVLSEEFQALCPEIPTKAATPFTGKLGGSLTCVKCGRERETKAEEFCELSLAPCYSVEASLER